MRCNKPRHNMQQTKKTIQQQPGTTTTSPQHNYLTSTQVPHINTTTSHQHNHLTSTQTNNNTAISQQHTTSQPHLVQLCIQLQTTSQMFRQ